VSRGRTALGGVGVVTLIALTACSSPDPSSGDGEAEAAGPTTEVTTAPSELSTVDSTIEPPTTAAATAAPTTTEAPTTTAAPPTTAPPTLPPTTLPPEPTLPPVPLNYEPIAPLDVPLAAVGTSGGAETARVQQRLLDLGFWLSAPDGQYGLTTRQAVMAFEKFLGVEADGSVDEVTAAYLSNLAEQAHGTADIGTLVEIDKTRQLLFLIIDGKTQWIFNTSTGNGQEYEEEDQNTPGEIVKGVSLTPDGLHKVYRERPEGWWEGDLGKIYRPKYFSGGAAVHGSSSVPNYPASHGCVRVTVEAMDFIWETGLMPMNLPVWVHGEEPV
jgi:hypothetical protein